MALSQQSADERRAFRRHDICVPVQIRIIDERSGQAISDPAHAVAMDVSWGGLRLHAVGALAEAVSRLNPARHLIEVAFVSPHLHSLGRLVGKTRWMRPERDAPGQAVGVQFGKGEPLIKESVTKALTQSGGDARRKIGSAVLYLVLLVGVGLGLFLVGSVRGKSTGAERMQKSRDEVRHLSTQLDRAAVELKQRSQRLVTLEEQASNCMDSLKACVARSWGTEEAGDKAVAGRDKQAPKEEKSRQAPDNVVVRMPPATDEDSQLELARLTSGAQSIAAQLYRRDRQAIGDFRVEIRDAQGRSLPCEVDRSAERILPFTCPNMRPGAGTREIRITAVKDAEGSRQAAAASKTAEPEPDDEEPL